MPWFETWRYGNILFSVHPWKLTWQLKHNQLKMYFLTIVIFRRSPCFVFVSCSVTRSCCCFCLFLVLSLVFCCFMFAIFLRLLFCDLSFLLFFPPVWFIFFAILSCCHCPNSFHNYLVCERSESFQEITRQQHLQGRIAKKKNSMFAVKEISPIGSVVAFAHGIFCWLLERRNYMNSDWTQHPVLSALFNAGKTWQILPDPLSTPSKNSWSFSLSDKIILKPTFDIGFLVYFRESTLVKLICYIFHVWRVVVKVHKLPAITGVL